MGLYRRNDSSVWWMSFTYSNRRYQYSTGTADKQTAQRIFDAVKGKIAIGNWIPEAIEDEKYTFDEFIERFLKEHAPQQAISTQARYQTALKHLKRFFSGMFLSEITANSITNFMQKRLQDGVTRATVNREFRTLSKAFSIAYKQWEWVEQNPCLKVSAFPENNTVNRYLLEEEEIMLLTAAQGYLNDQMFDIIKLAVHTGMRQSEILSLKWRQVDLFRRTITLYHTKNKDPRVIPLNQTVVNLLTTKIKEANDMSGYVFSTVNGTKILRHNLMREFYKALKKSKIDNFRFHDLRHTFATRLVQLGIDLYSVARLLGHRDIQSAQRYAHHNTESLRQSVIQLDKFLHSEDTARALTIKR